MEEKNKLIQRIGVHIDELIEQLEHLKAIELDNHTVDDWLDTTATELKRARFCFERYASNINS